MNNDNKKKKSKAAGLVVAILIAYGVLGVLNPSLFFFLNDNQKSAVALFRDTYLSPYLPAASSGGFDWMRLVALALVIIGAWLLVKIVTWIISKINFKNRNAKTVSSLVSNILKYAIVIYAIILGLSVMGVNTGALIASIGILGLIIGFGAQSLIEDVITGMFIIFEGQLHVGDTVDIGGFRGDVIAIGIRTTQLLDIRGNIKIINNSDIRSLINMSDKATVGVVTVEVTNDVEIEKIEKVMNDIMAEMPKKYPNLFTTAPQYLGIDDFVSNGLRLLVTTSVSEDLVYIAQRTLRRELVIGLSAAGIDDPANNVVVYDGEKRKPENYTN